MPDLEALSTIFGDRVVIDGGEDDGETARARRRALEKYSHDQVGDEHYHQIPAAVVFPTSTDEVAELMKWANRTGTPVTARGAGSGLAGAAVAVEGGVVCSFEKMDTIHDIDVENLMVTVQPGVITNKLDEALKPHGLFFAGYPMSEDICYIGGNVAENAGGGRAVKYGTTSAYVLGAEVVTATGEVLHLGGKRLKDVTGYNMLQLMIGSEGTLGLFTRLIIRVIPRPSVRGVVFAAFPDVAEATKCIAALKRESSESPSAIEFIDGETARSTNESLPPSGRQELDPETQAYLLIEFDGGDVSVVEALLQGASDLVADYGASIQAIGSEERMMETAWRLRKQIAWWVKRSSGRYHSLEDVVVPPATVPRLVAFVGKLRTRYRVPIAVFGHAGDGNFHITPMKSEELAPEQWAATVEQLLGELYHEVVRLGGTISGEHGIGRKRVKNLGTALSDSEILSMRSIKRALDPNNVLNPGVIFPA